MSFSQLHSFALSMGLTHKFVLLWKASSLPLLRRPERRHQRRENVICMSRVVCCGASRSPQSSTPLHVPLFSRCQHLQGLSHEVNQCWLPAAYHQRDVPVGPIVLMNCSISVLVQPSWFVLALPDTTALGHIACSYAAQSLWAWNEACQRFALIHPLPRGGHSRRVL